MCDQLIAIDPVSGEPRPSIAESWQVGEGGGNVFFKLRPDARFSDGTPVTAEDVQFTLSRLANQEFASPSAPLLERVSDYPYVHGEIPVKDAKKRRVLLGAQIVDSRTVSIVLIEPLSDFFRALSHPATSPVPRHVAERDPVGFARRPICSGPYKLSETPKPGSPIKLIRVKGYSGGNRSLSRSGRGYADAIELYPYGTRGFTADAYRRGVVDLAPISESDKAAIPAGSRLVTQASDQTELVGFPNVQPPFNDPRVRLALSKAIDRTDIARSVYGDRRVPASSLILPAFIGGNSAIDPSCASNAPASADIAGARALLAQAHVDPAAIHTTFRFNDEGPNRALVQRIVEQWKSALGITVAPVAMTWPAYRALATRPQGLDGIFRFSWAPAYPSAEQIVTPLFTLNGIGKNNWSLYSSRDVSDALREANQSADPRTRSIALRKVAKQLCTDMPMAPVVQAARTFIARSTIASAVGAFADSIDAQPLLRELYVV
ncbi:MAG: peptide ABC transporter substrate-binding protein [Actinomycetota bacterium]